MTVQWRKSSRSGGVNDEACVEVARLSGGIGVRDSKDPGAGHLTLTRSEFVSLLAQVKHGDLDR
jgi:hypothetical protein